ncbi:MAG: hypothetical protein H7177_15335 [Rhizobacter sp.]|nr:hypothetical protein [Bacteriovorax sp.]
MKIKALLALTSLLFTFSTNTFALDAKNCDQTPNFDFNKVLDQISKGLGKTTLKDGWYLTNYNLKIESDCTTRMKIPDLEKFYRNTMAEGTACMDRLSKKGIGKLGSVNNQCLVKLFEDKSNPPKLLCGGWPFGNDVWAVGSFPGSSKRHPYLWLSPNITKLAKENPLELQATIFHEMLHNCGYTHSEGIEIPYTCEQCCFSNDISADRKQSACNICGGKYSNEEDPAYIKDLFHWSKEHLSWGNDMRQRVYLASMRSKNTKTFTLVVNELGLASDQKNTLLKIFETKDAVARKNMLKDFSNKYATDAQKNLPLKSLLEWMNRD